MIYQVVTTVCFAYWPLMKQLYTDSMWITPFSSRSCHPCGQRHKSRALLRLPLVIGGNRCCLDFWGCAKYRKSVNCALPTSSPARAFNSRNKDHSSGDGSTTTLKSPPNIFSTLDGPLWSLWKVNLTVEGLRFLQTVCFPLTLTEMCLFLILDSGLRFLQTVCFPLTLTEMCLFLIRPKIERKKFLKWMICLQQYAGWGNRRKYLSSTILSEKVGPTFSSFNPCTSILAILCNRQLNKFSMPKGLFLLAKESES